MNNSNAEYSELRTIMKMYRKKHGLTQAELAAQIGMSTGIVAMWETGERIPTTQTLIKLGLISINSLYENAEVDR